MADKYQVPALKALALKRFRSAAEHTWLENPHFPEVVDQIYLTTRDKGLRSAVCEFVGAKIHRQDVRLWMQPVMAKHGKFAAKMLELLVRRINLFFYARVGREIKDMDPWEGPLEPPPEAGPSGEDDHVVEGWTVTEHDLGHDRGIGGQE